MKSLLLLVIRICVGASLIFSFLTIQAEPVKWQVADGGNGHFYEVIVADEISWPDANAAALRVNEYSHLATIQSQAENDFVNGLITTSSAWIGGIQLDGAAAPDEGWRWATAEPLTFVNWSPGEPNDSNPQGEDEVVIEMIPERDGGWNDVPITSEKSAYVVEWSTTPLDHYQCYIVTPEDVDEGDDDSKASVQKRTVVVEDQFGIKETTVYMPQLLCNPAGKDGAEIQNPRDHLVCYQIIRRERGPKSEDLLVTTSDQFGDLTLEVVESRLLCLPATKTLLEDGDGD